MSASGLIGPPLDIPAERLFRLLLRSPRASLPVVLPIAGAEHGAFFVRALHPLDEAEVYDNAPTGPAEVRRSVIGAGLAALALHDDTGNRVYSSGSQLRRLNNSASSDRLVGAVLERLHAVSPSLSRIDYDAWMMRLMTGARANYSQAAALACCVDGHIRRNSVPRPDRFYGIPIGELTDGQWLAFRASRKLVIDGKGND